MLSYVVHSAKHQKHDSRKALREEVHDTIRQISLKVCTTLYQPICHAQWSKEIYV